jgi:hypothetical protein
LQNAAGVGRRDQRLDHAVRSRMGLITPHHQPRHAEGAVDAAPSMAAEIEADEKIAGEKRRLDRAQFARMPDGLTPFWLKRAETLAIELTLRARFGKRQSVYRVPPLAIGKNAVMLVPPRCNAVRLAYLERVRPHETAPQRVAFALPEKPHRGGHFLFFHRPLPIRAAQLKAEPARS